MKVMNIIGIIGAAIVGYIVGKNHDKIRERINPSGKNETKETEETNVETIVEQADKPVLNKEDKPKPPNVDINAAKEEIAKKADSFSGIYEAIFEVENATSLKPDEVITEWNTRIHYLNSCPNIQKLWFSLFENYESFPPEQLQKSANAFLKFIYSTGIERDNRTQLIVDEQTRYKYYTLNDEKFVNGETLKVMLPCWTIDDRILEKGILTTITE
jgi:hypothetical protein